MFAPQDAPCEGSVHLPGRTGLHLPLPSSLPRRENKRNDGEKRSDPMSSPSSCALWFREACKRMESTRIYVLFRDTVPGRLSKCLVTSSRTRERERQTLDPVDTGSVMPSPSPPIEIIYRFPSVRPVVTLGSDGDRISRSLSVPLPRPGVGVRGRSKIR